MDKTIDLLSIDQKNVHEIKKNIPNMEVFLEEACSITDSCSEADTTSVIRLDLYHFKQINDDYGFDVGDNVIVACYDIIKSNLEKFSNNYAIGRAHGDEFVSFLKCSKEDINNITKNIIEDIKSYDFSSIGCKREIGAYIGAVIGKERTVLGIRSMIDTSHESTNEARKNGKNSIVISKYGI